MYSKEENYRFRKEFWTRFGQYMKPVAGKESAKTNWVNYKTGISQLYFRMDVTRQEARIGIEITSAGEDRRLEIYRHFLSLKKILETTLEESWIWKPQFVDEHGQDISIIYTQLPGVNINDQEDWPRIISFLKKRIMALDIFWTDNREFFDIFK